MAEGMDVVPCILAEGLTAEQRRAYILADNRLAELAEWDRQALRVELQALNDLGFDLELTGFSLEALPFRLDGEPPAAEEDAEAPVQGRHRWKAAAAISSAGTGCMWGTLRPPALWMRLWTERRRVCS